MTPYNTLTCNIAARARNSIYKQLYIKVLKPMQSVLLTPELVHA